jgi:hypothetical protein
MKFGPLTIIERGHCGGEPARHWVVAAWHWRWSITWRWLIWWIPSWRFWQGWYFGWQQNMPWKL